MNIEKLQMCRLCLVEDVRMINVTNKDLHTLYEKLTDITFVTVDRRPMLACVFCYTKLKQCCELQRKCLESEKLLTQMLNEDDETKPQINKDPLEFVKIPTVQINCVLDECQSGSYDIKEELPDDCEGHTEIKEEHQTEPDCPDLETNHYVSDSEDDSFLIDFKMKEPEVSKEKQRAGETQSANDALKPELYVRQTKLEFSRPSRPKKTKRNTQRRKTTARSKRKKLKANCKSIRNILNNSVIATNDQKQTYTCDLCQRSFSLKSRIKCHMRIHTGERPYKCEVCQKTFNREDYLKIHYRIHSGEKPYKCEICQKSFYQLQHLKLHSRVHSGDKPYKCEICLRSFSRDHHLKRHILVHTGEKPYECEICHRSFTQAGTLKTHYRVHTGNKRTNKKQVSEV